MLLEAFLKKQCDTEERSPCEQVELLIFSCICMPGGTKVLLVETSQHNKIVRFSPWEYHVLVSYISPGMIVDSWRSNSTCHKKKRTVEFTYSTCHVNLSTLHGLKITCHWDDFGSWDTWPQLWGSISLWTLPIRVLGNTKPLLHPEHPRAGSGIDLSHLIILSFEGSFLQPKP